jgi:hypothetical protein
MLRRIIALLVALAALTERIETRSLPVRCLVFWILRRAASVADDFVFEAMGTPPPAVGGIAAVRNGPTDALDALLLAARFKALAAALGALLSVALRLDRRLAGRAFGHAAPRYNRLPVALAGWVRKPNDTS